MFKWEKKLIENIDKCLLPLAFLLITLVALLIRRQGIWHVSFDYQNQFYIDAPGYMHTPFYTWLIRLISYLPNTPIRTMKWLICGFDFAVAVMVVFFLKRLCEQFSRMAALVCYGLLLISPLVLEYGLVWIHVDSICLSAMLGAVLCLSKKSKLPAGLLMGLACALQIQYLIVAIAIFVWLWKKEKLSGVWLFTVGLTIIILNAIGCIMTGVAFRDAWYSLINWLMISPASGELFSSWGEWLKMMLLYYGYLMGIGTVVLAYYRPKYQLFAASIHIVLLIYVAQILQYGY